MAKEMRTGVIRFNLKERMRTYNGTERNFNIKALVNVINGEKVQERVRLGDLNGYYGHYPRIKWGAEPGESRVDNGKMVILEPCCRTIKLKAYDDGTIEHEQEFLNTELGRKAWERLQDKSGGFSSVITTGANYDFHGFDYVNEPNYSSNRPYTTLDSVNASTEGEVFVMDDVGDINKAERQMLLDSIALYTSENEQLKAENALLTDSITNLSSQNDELLEETISLKEKIRQLNNPQNTQGVTLDSVIEKANRFKQATLESFANAEDNSIALSGKNTLLKNTQVMIKRHFR